MLTHPNLLKTALLILVCISGCTKQNTNSSKNNNQEEIVSYIFGYNTGKGFREQGISINLVSFNKGIKDGISSDAIPVMTEQDMQKLMSDFRLRFKETRRQELETMAKKNKIEGENLFENNKKNKDIRTLESGLQYKVIKQGNGSSPRIEDTVNLEYVGTLLNGKEFDSSKKQEGGLAKLQVKRTIKGVSEALQLMKVGDEWQIFIPPSLAYGEQNVGAVIGPNETLIFMLKLVGIDPLASAEAENPDATILNN